jgi:Tol biopolymer transport system component
LANNVDHFGPVGLAGFSVSSNGVLAYHAGESMSRLLWISRAGAQTGTVGPVAGYETVRLSPDGKRLAVDLKDPRTTAEDVHVFDLPRGTDRRVTTAPGAEFGPIWSPDGRRLVYAGDRDAPPYLHQTSLDDLTTVEPLVRPSTPQTPSDWHPSGRFIAFYRGDPATANDIWIVPLDGDRTPYAFARSRFNETSGRFSPDGRWLAYESDEAGQPDIYVRAFPGPGEAHRISTGGGSNPRWRRDGKELFYVAAQRMMAVPVNSTVSFDAGAARELFDRKPARIIDYDVAADGQSFLINGELSSPDTKPINVVINWMSVLK